MLPGQIGICLLVMPKRFCLGIEGYIPAEMRADVAQVTNRGRQPADFDVGIGCLAAPHTIQEILFMQATLPHILGLLTRPSATILEIDLPTLVGEQQSGVGTDERDSFAVSIYGMLFGKAAQFPSQHEVAVFVSEYLVSGTSFASSSQ